MGPSEIANPAQSAILAPTLAPGLAGRRVPFDRIPIVDLARLIDGTDEAGVAAEVARCCTEVGFLYVRNHGIPQGLVDDAFAETRRFFDLPLERKMALHIKKSRAHRGYFPVFEENTDPKLTADLKEGFDLAREVPESDPRVVAGKPLHGPNVWPDDLPGFRTTIDAYYAALMRLAGTLMRAFALGLELPPTWFADKIDDAMGALRLLHYPPQGGYIKHETLGCGAHSDYGCLTILAQDQVGGLQVQNCVGDWIEAPPIPGTFVINLGEQMARWTNDRFAATLHRVINASGRERYSMPFFFEPNYDARIACLPSCVSPAEPARYAPVIAGEYLAERFNQTFKYRGGEGGAAA